jgi:hypothetical protein
MNAAIIWDIAQHSPHVSRCFVRIYHLYPQGRKWAVLLVVKYRLYAGFCLGWFSTLRMEVPKHRFTYTLQLRLLTANVVPSSPILVTLMMEALSSSETLVLTRATGVTFKNTPFLRETALHMYTACLLNSLFNVSFCCICRVRFPALSDFLNSSGSGTGSTQPLKDKWGATWKKK